MRELNQGLDPNIPSQKIVIDLNNKNEKNKLSKNCKSNRNKSSHQNLTAMNYKN